VNNSMNLMRPVVVTGADGFVGRSLVDRLRKQGAEVIAIDSEPTVEGTIKANICDPMIEQWIPPQSIVIHLAALSTDGQCRQEPEKAVRVNILGTLNLANVSKQKGASQFIFASSEWVYGDTNGEEVKTESSPVDVATLTSVYAVTKAATEPMLRSEIAPENVTNLRFGIVYGPRPDSWSAVERLLVDVSEKATIQVGSVRTGRRFIYVDDLVDGILASIGQLGFSTFNLSGNDLVTIGDIITTSARLLSRAPEVIEASPDDWVQRNPSNALAVETLGWSPQHDISQGIREVADFLGLVPPLEEPGKP
jgi:nucleoside-diphosphate-sugar epimerase